MIAGGVGRRRLVCFGGGPFFRYRVVSLVPDAPSSEFLIGPMIIRYWTRLANRP